MENMILFFVSLASLAPSSTAIHSLQYFTAVTAWGNFTFGLVDGEQFLYYSSSNNRTVIAEWIKESHKYHPRYWEREKQRLWGEQMDLPHHFSRVVKAFNHTAGNHTLQWRYGCELHDNGTTRRYNLYKYGHSIFPNLQHTRYLKNECIHSLKEYVSFLNSSHWRVRPKVFMFQKHSSPPEVVCHATGFFPKAVNITWQKDGEDVHEDVDVRETLPNQDGSFQKRSVLRVPAEELQKHTYTCVIQHSSLGEELVLPVSERRILSEHRGGGSDKPTAIALVCVGVLAVALFLSLPVLMEYVVDLRWDWLQPTSDRID